MDERRQLPRWEIKKEVKVLLAQTQDISHCIIEDMHLKGMCISFDKQLPSQGSLDISFAIEDDADFIKIEAQVPWAKQGQGRYFYGLSFSKIAEEDKNKIDEYIQTNCQDQFKDKWWGEVN